jgi:hypothetical protein
MLAFAKDFENGIFIKVDNTVFSKRGIFFFKGGFFWDASFLTYYI